MKIVAVQRLFGKQGLTQLRERMQRNFYTTASHLMKAGFNCRLQSMLGKSGWSAYVREGNEVQMPIDLPE